MATMNGPVYDADNHLYETEEAFTRHLPDQYRGAIRYVEVDGRTKIAVNNTISEYIPNPTFDVVAAPGAWEEYYRGNNPDGKTLREITGTPVRCWPEFRNPSDRLALLDRQGVDATLMFPTLASLLEQRMQHDIDLTHAAVHAFNQWLLDDWSFNVENRIFPTPVITLPDPVRAIEELEWCVAEGARVVLIRPAPVPGLAGSRSMGLPEFDPFWDAVEAADVLVAFHASDSGYDSYASAWEGGRSEFLPFKPAAFRMVITHGRPIYDTMAALICHGMFARHPKVRVAAIENGSMWVRPLLDELAVTYGKMPQEFAEDPVETFRRHISVSPFYEENINELIELIGPDRVLFGSDFPHPEGLADPVTFLSELDGQTDEVRTKVMGANLATLLGAA
ncbi:MAG: amidohydrolase family protein [Acidimicrobiales bacterium]